MPYLVLPVAYLIGSLPFGYIFTKMFLNTDIRRHGSGNIGATNVLRLLGWRAALPVFALDLAKGAAAVLLARAISDVPFIFLGSGLAVMIGHSFPVFLGFRGGKAVAAGIGVLFALSGWVALIMILGAVAVIAVTRYVSLGSMIGVLTVPFLFWLMGFDYSYIIFGAGMAALVIFRHHANIGRLWRGTESRLGQKIAAPS